MKRQRFIGILLVSLLITGITACGNDEEPTGQQPAESDTNVPTQIHPKKSIKWLLARFPIEPVLNSYLSLPLLQVSGRC